MINYEDQRLFDDSVYFSEASTCAKPVIDTEIERYMQFVELHPGEPGYVVDENGYVQNVYVREFSPDLWGQDSDIFELRYLSRKTEESNQAFAIVGGYFLSLFELTIKNEAETE